MESVYIPNNFIDALSLIDTMAELKVVLYVMRHTWGFQEYDTHKKITIDEFVNGRKLKNRGRMDHGAGLGQTAVKIGVAKAVEHGFLECEIDETDRARIKKCYRLKLKPPTEIEAKERRKPVTTNTSRLAELQSMPYASYLQSPEWIKRRQKALRFAGFRCQVCNASEGLNVHHRTYKRIGHENMGDLVTLCKKCHEIFHHNGELTEE